MKIPCHLYDHDDTEIQDFSLFQEEDIEEDEEQDNLEQEMSFEETVEFAPNTQCVATRDFVASDATELSFMEGDLITIVEPSNVMFWYIAKNQAGQTGKVPINFLEEYDDQYVDMDANGVPRTQEAKAMHSLLEQENKSRLKNGTLVIGKANFPGDSPEDLPFEIGEELQILKPTGDLGWYEAKRCYRTNQDQKMEGTIPITHIRLIYDDSSDDEDADRYAAPIAQDDRLYDDINDFITNSGWFTYTGKPHGVEALRYVLAKKCGIDYDEFMLIKQAVYMFAFGNEEKVYIGKADVLNETLVTHFECFGKPRSEIRAIDDELCHHSPASFWQLKVWPIASTDNLELEWIKKMCLKHALPSPDGGGLNEYIKFTSMDSWKAFKDWFYPKDPVA